MIRLLLFLLGTVVSFLPRKLEVLMGRGLGLFFYFFVPLKRKKIARENLNLAFAQERSQGEIEKILRRNFEHHGILLMELLHFFSLRSHHYRKYVQASTSISGLEHWNAARSKQKGVLFVSSHLANWEFMVGVGALAGIPISMMTKQLKPAWFHRRFEQVRLNVGVKAAYEPRTLPTILRALRANEAVGFVMDQYAGPPIGIRVPFFGVRVGTLAAVATLVKRTGAEVLMAKTFRLSDAKVCVEIQPFQQEGLEKTSGNFEEEYTALLTQRIESWIREFPEQWLWTHRRFKNIQGD